MDAYAEIEAHTTVGVLKHLLPWRVFLTLNNCAGHMADHPGKTLDLKDRMTILPVPKVYYISEHLSERKKIRIVPKMLNYYI